MAPIFKCIETTRRHQGKRLRASNISTGYEQVPSVEELQESLMPLKQGAEGEVILPLPELLAGDVPLFNPSVSSDASCAP
eukprot:4528336-Amphidinium_carterae.1